MKILLISLWSISENSIGGTERFVIDLASLLSKDHSVTVLSLGSIDLDIKDVNTNNLNIIDRLDDQSLSKYLKNEGFSEIELKLKSFLEKNKFDIIHCNSLLFANLIKTFPVIQTVHTNKEEFYGLFPKNITDIILDNIKSDKNTTYIVPSVFAKESFLALTQKKGPLVISHGFRSNIILHDKILLRQKYKIPNDDIVFCIPSRLEIQQKGQEILLAALQEIQQELPSFTVVLGGCDEQYLENKKYLYKKYPNIKMVIEGFPDKSDMYSLSNIIILPSRTESFGYAALESAMIGFPVFLSDIPPYAEIAKDNPQIILFKNNKTELAKILLERHNIVSTHSAISPPKKWKERYSKKNMLQSYLSLYSQCITDFRIEQRDNSY